MGRILVLTISTRSPRINTLRIIGDVHAQIGDDDLLKRGGRPYLQLIAGAEYSVQIGDMGDGLAYDQLREHVDLARHRFFPGNHDHYDQLPPHSLGDFGLVSHGGVEFFFVRGAASTDRDKLVRLGRELGKTLWYEEEQLTAEQMQAAEAAYKAARPKIMLTHDAPTDIARAVWRDTSRPSPGESFRASRTNEFLAQLFELHQPRVWLFGHHHHNWRLREGATEFVCVGELVVVEVSAEGHLT